MHRRARSAFGNAARGRVPLGLRWPLVFAVFRHLALSVSRVEGDDASKPRQSIELGPGPNCICICNMSQRPIATRVSNKDAACYAHAQTNRHERQQL
jgi:hypothetical protein